jgi:lambda family phage tail tape measure protein
MSKIKILVIPSDRTGVGFFRSVDPHVMIQNLYPNDFHIDIDYEPNIQDANFLKQYQIVHIHRNIGSSYEGNDQLIKWISSLGITTVVDSSDLGHVKKVYQPSIKAHLESPIRVIYGSMPVNKMSASSAICGGIPVELLTMHIAEIRDMPGEPSIENLDDAGRAKRRDAYETERLAIVRNTETQKAAAEQRIREIQQQQNALKNLNDLVAFSGQQQTRILQEQSRFAMEGMNYKERIAAEEKLNQITSIRQQLLNSAAQSGLGGASLDKLRQQINIVTSDTNLLGKSWTEINDAILQSIASSGAFSEEQRRSVTEYLSLQQQNIESITRWSESLSRIRQAQAESQREFSYGWNDAFRRFADDANNAAKQANMIFNRLTSGLEDLFVNFAKTGRLSFRSLLQGIAEDILRSQVRQLIAQLLPTFGGGGGRSSGGGGLFGGKIIPGFLADGGPALANKPYIVGERGPELFVPNTTGTVVPNDAMGGGTTMITYNINAVDAPSFQALVARDPQFIFSVSEMGRRTIPGARA